MVERQWARQALHEAERELQQASVELEELRRQALAAEVRVDQLREAIATLGALAGKSQFQRINLNAASSAHTHSISRPEKPSTTEAVLKILLEQGQPMPAQAILKHLERRDWMPDSKDPLNALRAALSRLQRDPESPVALVDRNVYAYDPSAIKRKKRQMSLQEGDQEGGEHGR